MTLIDEILNDNRSNPRIQELHEFCKNSAIVLYGAGLTGRSILKKLQANQVHPLFIVDDTPSKQGTQLEGVMIRPVSSLKDISQPFALVVTMMNPEMNFESVRKNLQGQGVEHVFSFLELSFVFPGDLLPYFHFDVKQNLLKDHNDIKNAFGLFNEPLSKQIFLNNLSFRLNLDFATIPVGDKDDYFPASIIDIPGNAVLFDCGAFDGDTVRSFLLTHKDFDSIYAFEPDPENFNKLLKYCAGLDEAVSKKIYVFNNGLGEDHRYLKFNSLSNMASAINDEGDCIIQTIDLDSSFFAMLKEHGGPVFIKMDIEGAEPQALKGCRKIITEISPCLAISIYHNPDDLWKITLYLNSLNPKYQFLLRQHGNDSMDLVLYAIPG